MTCGGRERGQERGTVSPHLGMIIAEFRVSLEDRIGSNLLDIDGRFPIHHEVQVCWGDRILSKDLEWNKFPEALWDDEVKVVERERSRGRDDRQRQTETKTERETDRERHRETDRERDWHRRSDH
jgi:hypothetical protein